MTIPTAESQPVVPDGFRIVEISREPIELYKILKFEGMTESGGHARAAVASGRVSVNGAVEIQKRKKIRSGDTIEFADHRVIIRFCPPVNSDAEHPEPASIPAKVASNVTANDSAETAAKQNKVSSRSGTALVVRTTKRIDKKRTDKKRTDKKRTDEEMKRPTE